MTQPTSVPPHTAAQPYGPPAPMPTGGPAPYGAAPYGAAPYGPAPSGPPAAPPRRTGRVVAAVLGALVVLAGLATGALLLFGGRTLDTAEAERQIARITEEQAGVAPTQVSCPEDVPLEAGTTTRCTAQLDGQPISFTVRQTDDEGNVRVDSDSSFVIVAAVEQSLTQQVGDAAGVPVTATCDTGGRTVLVDGAGTPIPCTVTNTGDATDTLDVVATVDDQGAVSYQPAG